MAERYLAFCGRQYYPDGGAGDFVGKSDSLEGAKALAETACQAEWGREGAPDPVSVWWHVFDADAGKIVAFFGRTWAHDELEEE